MLRSSIHSSFAEASVPDQASSLIMTERGGNGVVAGGGISVAVGVFDAVGEGVGEFVMEGDGVGVSGGVFDGVDVAV